MNKKSIKSALLACAGLGVLLLALALSYALVRHFLIKNSEVLVHAVAQSLSPALLTNDTEQVERMLKSLQQYPGVESAELLSSEGATIASYVKEGPSYGVPSSAPFELASLTNDSNHLYVTAPITFDSLVIANLHMVVNLWPMFWRVIIGFGVLLMIPSVIYVVIKQLRIKVRFEKKQTIDDASNQDEASFDLAGAVGAAMEDADISLEYQPIHRLSDGGLYGMDVVVCWRHPSGQTFHLSPSDFIALAKRSGVIVSFDDWLLTTACSQAMNWQHHFGPLVLCLDISESQWIDPNFAQHVREICRQTKYPHQLLELQVHESVVAAHAHHAPTFLQAFAEAGLSVTVDCFGLSRSSCALLSTISVRKVKLDRKLVRYFESDPQVAQLVSEILAQARSCEVQVMGAGISQETQSRALQQMGCTLGQGAYFCSPMSATVFELFLAARPFGVSVSSSKHTGLAQFSAS